MRPVTPDDAQLERQISLFRPHVFPTQITRKKKRHSAIGRRPVTWRDECKLPWWLCPAICVRLVWWARGRRPGGDAYRRRHSRAAESNQSTRSRRTGQKYQTVPPAAPVCSGGQPTASCCTLEQQMLKLISFIRLNPTDKYANYHWDVPSWATEDPCACDPVPFHVPAAPSRDPRAPWTWNVFCGYGPGTWNASATWTSAWNADPGPWNANVTCSSGDGHVRWLDSANRIANDSSACLDPFKKSQKLKNRRFFRPDTNFSLPLFKQIADIQNFRRTIAPNSWNISVPSELHLPKATEQTIK